MNDLQRLMDAMNDVSRNTRSDYHLTLGAALEALAPLSDTLPVRLDNGQTVGEVDSYRGYYADLAFEPGGENGTVGQVRADLQQALGKTFEGYKGGDFVMGPDTPLWVSAYGLASGIAVIALNVTDDGVILITRSIR